MPIPSQPDRQLGDLDTLTLAVHLPDDIITQILPCLPGNVKTLTIASFPDDVLERIISFFPKFPRDARGHNLKEVYDLLSLARLHPGCAHLFSQLTSSLECIDPFPETPHTEPSAQLPPYAKPEFLCLLVSICRKLYSLHAPSVKRVLGFAGNHLRSLSFVDDGLLLADLIFISRSSLKSVAVTNPSEVVLSALSQIKTLTNVSFLRVSANVVTHVRSFFKLSRVAFLILDLVSTEDHALFYLLQRLPISLETLLLKCDARHAWSMLKYLRGVATKIESVYLMVGGIKIAVRQKDATRPDNGKWESSLMYRLIFWRDFRSSRTSPVWPRGVCLKEIDFELLEECNDCQVPRNMLERRFLHHFESVPIQPGITVRLGRSLPSMEQVRIRSKWISRTNVARLAKTLVVSQDIVRYVRSGSAHWMYKYLMSATSNFIRITTLQLCLPLHGGKLSGRFVMALPDFLKVITQNCSRLESIYLEDAGELVLQTVGIPVLTNEKRLKQLLKFVIKRVKKMERESKVEMGTLIAQLETWAGRELRVDADVLMTEAMPWVA